MNHQFSLESVAEHLANWGCKLTRIENGVQWDNKWGRSEVVIEQRSATTLDRQPIVGAVYFRHHIRKTGASNVDDIDAAHWNSFAALSALIPASNTDTASLVSRATLYGGLDPAALETYAALICTEAYMQPAAILAAASGKPIGPDYFDLSNGDGAPPYSEGDFESVVQLCRERGLLATTSGVGLTAEFPWDAGAVSAEYAIFAEAVDDPSDKSRLERMAGRTFLFQMSTTERHPCLGRGLLCRLDVPVSPSTPVMLPRIVSELNRWECNAVDMPPLFGGWCINQQLTSPAHVMFLPNELCYRAMPRMVTAWMAHRAQRVRSVLASLM